ncbi:MAG: amylo-alpha-1,6-glucosidase [Anaerolineae bacterium]
MSSRKRLYAPVEEAKQAALGVMLHNLRGPYRALPRTAGWGYPEPYTRDMMLSALGVLTTGNEQLIAGLRKVLVSLAQNQSRHGHMPSLAHDSQDRGASDTTPLFLIGLSAYRSVTGESGFLEEAAQKALVWMDYQSPDDSIIVAQQPTSDWRDEQWVLGYGLYVNTLVYTYLRMYGRDDDAIALLRLMNRFAITEDRRPRHVHEGLVMPHKPYYALWSYKVLKSDRFDLLGNSLAVLSGIASCSRGLDLVRWIEAECDALREKGLLASALPPCLFPYIRPADPDWHHRYEVYGPPGDYHNGGIWPFISGVYIAALVAGGRQRLATEMLGELAHLVRPAREHDVAFGFNEWYRAQDVIPRGQDWQSWSAALYLYAAACVERQSTPFFDEVRARRNVGDPDAALSTVCEANDE